MTSVLDLGARAHALRSAFDRGFSEPPALVAPITEDLLAVTISGDPYALRLSELSGLVSNRKVVALPTGTPHLLGIAGVRGGIVPVYGLASLLGYEGTRAAGAWLALCGRQEPVALAFEQLDGFLRVPRAALHPVGVELSKQHVAEGVRTGSVTRRVVDTRSALTALQAIAGSSGIAKDPMNAR